MDAEPDGHVSAWPVIRPGACTGQLIAGGCRRFDNAGLDVRADQRPRLFSRRLARSQLSGTAKSIVGRLSGVIGGSAR